MIEPAFLLDSNMVIYVLADSQSRPAVRLAQCLRGAVVTSAIVYAEVMRGVPAYGPDALSALKRFFALVPVLPFDERAADHYLQMPFKRGRMDRLIGAHALSLRLTLVTNNEADFADIPGLRIENWTQA